MNSSIYARSKYSVLVYVVSGVFSGVIASIPNQSYLINWAPGLIFGIIFAVCNIEKKWRIVLYTILSGIIYRLAVQIAVTVANDKLRVPSFLFAGLSGSLGLVILTWQLSRTKFSLQDGIRTIFIGGVTGIVFWFILTNLKVAYLSPALAYTAWQVPVAMSLITGIEKQRIKKTEALAKKQPRTDIYEKSRSAGIQLDKAPHVNKHPHADALDSMTPAQFRLKRKSSPFPKTATTTKETSAAPKLDTIPTETKQDSKVGWLFAFGTILIIGVIFVTNLPSNSSRQSSSSATQNIPSPTHTPTPQPRFFNVRIDGDVTTDIQVTTDEYVWVLGGGTISLGFIASDVPPDGLASSLWRKYNIEREFPYGSLLCRIEGESWMLCGSDRELRFSKAGRLEFAINDNTIGNGHTDSSWDVQIIVSSYSYKSVYAQQPSVQQPSVTTQAYDNNDPDWQRKNAEQHCEIYRNLRPRKVNSDDGIIEDSPYDQCINQYLSP